MGKPIERYYVYYEVDVRSGRKYYEIRDKLGQMGFATLVSTHDNAEEAHNLTNLANSAYEDEVRKRVKENWHSLFF